MLFKQNKDKSQTKITPPLWKQYQKHRGLMLMFLPGFLLLLVFSYFPLYGILIAFKDFKISTGVWASPWVGLKHFEMLFSDYEFLLALKNTLVISVLKLVIGFPMPIILAILINEIRFIRYKKTLQMFSYLPHFFSWVVLGGMITQMFSATGPVNTLLSYVGFDEPVPFFSDPTMFLVLLIVTAIWQSVGWNSVIYIAAITGVDHSLYEAAEIDGAGKLRQVLSITIPSIAPTIITLFILNLGQVVNAGFDQIYNLYNPVVYEVSDIIDTLVLRKMQTMNYSFGTAVGLFKSVVGLVLILGTNFIVKKLSDGEQGII